jgi:hypothetical protein
MLLLLACDGRLLSLAQVGRVDSVAIMPISNAGTSDVLLYHETARGSGYERQDATVYSLRTDVILDLWSGVVFEGMYMGPDGTNREERGIVSVAPGSLTRTVQVQRLRFSEARNKYVPAGPPRASREAYRWDGARFRRLRASNSVRRPPNER